MNTTAISNLYRAISCYHVTNLPPRIHILTAHLQTLIPSSLSLSLAPLLVLADFSHIPRRTIQAGTSSLIDALTLCPSLHKQSSAASLSNGEYPATAAMTTGYVFRTENQAMVHYLQQVGRTGSLVTLTVRNHEKRRLTWARELVFGCGGLDAVSLLLAVMTLDVIAGLIIIGDGLALAYILILVLSRLLNMLAIRRRLAPEWHGASEPMVMGDLLVLLSQDRWIRIRGLVDDLKAVTSGQWLRDNGFVEDCLVDVGTVLVYAGVIVGSNATQRGSLMVAVLLAFSSVLLALSNRMNGKVFYMHGRVVSEVGNPKKYVRRRDMADELIKISGRDDWAVQLGMIPGNEKGSGPAIM